MGTRLAARQRCSQLRTRCTLPGTALLECLSPGCQRPSPPSRSPSPLHPQGLQQASWPEAFAAVARAASKVQGHEMRAVAGKLADAESMLLLKDLMNRLGCGDLRVRRPPAPLSPADGPARTPR